MSLPTSSVVTNITLVAPEPAQPVHYDHPKKYFFGTAAEAIAWRTSLKGEDEQFLYRLDTYIAKMLPGMRIDTARILKDGTPELFYRSLSYILTFSGLVNCFSWSDDYQVITKMDEFNPA